MQYEIDQSGKVEQTNRDTIVALSNSITYVVSISAKEKRLLLRYFRKQSKPNRFVLVTFSYLVAQVIASVPTGTHIVIDTEYLGYQSVIKSEITQFFKFFYPRHDLRFSFGFIGKYSNAHIHANRTLRRKQKADRKVLSKEKIKALEIRNKK